MKVIFTNLAVANYTRFFDVKPGSFMFEESNICTIKVSTEPNSVSANETISNAIGNITKAIKDASAPEAERLKVELEIVMDYYKSNKEMSAFLKQILEKIEPKEEDWD